jgi:Protein of unknown function (DUF2795)
MERGSDKLNPRVDAELQQETEGMERGAPVEPRAEEFRKQEEGAEDQPAPDARPEQEGPVEARSDLARHLEPSAFPADRDRLLTAAREQEAPDHLIGLLSGLPEGRTFENVEEVWEALGGEPPDPERF